MIWVIVAAVVGVLSSFAIIFGAPYVPSRRRYIERVFRELYPLTKDDLVVDAGSGDGIVLRIVAENGARAIGYEINPLLFVVSKLLSLRHSRATTVLANFWTVPLPRDTSIVYVFGVSRDGKKFTKKFQSEADRLSRPLLVICYGSPLPDIMPVRQLDAYHLYIFHPLHRQKAQV